MDADAQEMGTKPEPQSDTSCTVSASVSSSTDRSKAYGKRADVDSLNDRLAYYVARCLLAFLRHHGTTPEESTD
jgi:hypothetical protein